MAPKFNRDFNVEYGRVEQLSPLIRRVVANNPNRFTFTGTGTYLVGRGDVAVIDPGPADDQHVAAIVGALEPHERISHVAITHTHSDHSPGAALLKSLGVDAPTFGYGPHGAVAEDDPNDVVRSVTARPTPTTGPTLPRCGKAQTPRSCPTWR